jgi:hypothetical protein
MELNLHGFELDEAKMEVVHALAKTGSTETPCWMWCMDTTVPFCCVTFDRRAFGLRWHGEGLLSDAWRS